MNKYFIYDPENNEFEIYTTLAEQAMAAEEIIKSYLDTDNSWPEEVTGIVSGIITERATKCDGCLPDMPFLSIVGTGDMENFFKIAINPFYVRKIHIY